MFFRDGASMYKNLKSTRPLSPRTGAKELKPNTPLELHPQSPPSPTNPSTGFTAI